ncbi:tRNA (guanosine(37)-N1)-methyltransferase TrmD [Blattabacterium cuenoti]|uniref:tRNA (guanosine(37)-N1)-methyltransferase TrmD n=1 Tax=Blattabacterium cuenoti TaxID=1653831 RepID=UPI00163C524E|nr:tRNA (guanosine(37)-N1)-methyltransferase TrmD [Blattabacterium cuenoti]
MRIDIVSIFPRLFNEFLYNFPVKKAIHKELLEVHVHDLRQYGIGKKKKVDDYPYGGGGGMVLKIEPVYQCFNTLLSERYYDETIFMTPSGKSFTQKYAEQLTKKTNLLILCGRYKGVDQRIIDHLISKEISIGPYILSGGELAAAVIVESITRLLPGVLNYSNSIGGGGCTYTSYPIYTHPSIYNGWPVPQILLSGNHRKIKDWRIINSKNKDNNKDK